MATITSLGFNIFSKFNREGVREAERSLSSLDAKVRDTNQSFRAAAGSTRALTMAVLALTPSVAVLGSVTAAGATAVAANMSAAGVAVGAYGAVMSHTIKRTIEMKEAGEALTASQASFISSTENMTRTWHAFLDAHDHQTLAVARDGIDGIVAGIHRMNPLLDATHPIIKRTSEAWKSWMEGDGSRRFADNIIAYGIPALDNFEKAGRNILAVLGEGFRTALPEGVGFSAMVLRASEAARTWATNGGFTRFMQFVKDNKDVVLDFFAAMAAALWNVARAVSEMGPGILTIATALLNLIAAMPTGAIQGFFIALMSLKVVVLVAGWIGQLVATLKVLSWAMSIGMGPIGLIVVAIAAVIAAIVWIATQTDWFQKAWTWAWNLIKDVAKNVADWFVATWGAVWGWVSSTAVDAWDWIVTAWTNTTGAVVDAGRFVIDWFMSWWSPTWEFVASVATTVWGALKTAWNVFASAMLDIYRGLVQPVIDAFRNVWPEVVQAVTNAWNVITAVVGWGWKLLAGLFQYGWSVIEPIVTFGWNIISSAFQTGFGLITTVVSTGWNVLVGIFTFAWDVISTVVKFGWDMVVAVFRVGWDVIFAGLRAFSTVFLAIWSPLWDVFSTIATGAWNVLKAAWQVFVDILEAIMLTFLAVFTGNWSKAWDAIKQVAVSVWEWIQVSWQATVDVIMAIGRAGTEFLSAVWSAAWGFMKDVVEAVWNGIVSFVTAVWEGFKGMWQAGADFLSTVWTSVWNGIRDYIVLWWTGTVALFTTSLDFVKSLWTTVWTFISDFFVAVWNGIRDFFVGLWTGMVLWFTIKWNEFVAFCTTVWNQYKEAWSLLWNTVKSLFEGVWNGLIAFMRTAWDTIKGIFQSFSDWILNTFWTPINDFFTKIIPNAFQAAVDAIKTAWETLRDIVKAPIKFIVDFVYNKGIVPMWNLVTGVFGGAKLEEMSFAQGGPVRGPGTGTSDSIPARLSNGEHVWTKREVDAAGGHQAVAALRSAVTGRPARVHGTPEATYAFGGGVLDWIGDQWNGLTNLVRGKVYDSVAPMAISMRDATKEGLRTLIPGEPVMESVLAGGIDKMVQMALSWIKSNDVPVGGSAMGWQSMWRIVKSNFPDATLTSGLRPGDTGYHGRGQAIDVAWPMNSNGIARMLTLNRWIAENHPAAAELIHTPGVNLYKGKPHTYSAATQASHYDHVHWATDTFGSEGGALGGAIPSGHRLSIINQALNAAGIPPPGTLDQWQAGLNTLIQRESSWNNGTVNTWDSNARAGTPSQGLAQVIGPTFAAYRVRSLPNDPFHEVANVAAAARYIVARYGNITNVQQANASMPPKGYALGTYGATSGIRTVAENGPELITRGPVAVRFRGGEQVWNTGATQDMFAARHGGETTEININTGGAPLVDARGATAEAVDKLHNEFVPELRQALASGVGRKLGGR